jgi:predicted MFS family arabinose efflux permease
MAYSVPLLPSYLPVSPVLPYFPDSHSRRLGVPWQNPWRGAGGLPASVWIVFATTLVNRAGTMVLPFMVLYVTRELGVSAALAGMALTVYGVGGLVSGPVAGRLCDRLGPFSVLRGALLLSGMILLVFPLASRFETFLAITLVWAFIAESVRPATLAALTTYVRPDQRKAAVAVNRLSINLGMSIGPAVGGFLATVSFPLLFLVDGVTAIAAGLVLAGLMFWRPIREVPPASTSEALQPGSWLSVLRDRRALVFFTGLFLMALVFFQHEGAMPIFLVRDLHYKESFYGILFAVNTLLIVVLEVPLNLAMASWSHRWTMVLGAVLFAVGFGSMAVLHSKAGLLLADVIWTFGEMIAMPASGAYTTDIAPPGRAGQYAGAYASTFSLAVLVGPWAGTIALDKFGGTALWAGVMVVGLVGAAVLCWLEESREAPVASRG